MEKERLRYAILREIEEGNTPLNEKDFYISESEFDEAVNFLTREQYLKGIYWADDRPHVEKVAFADSRPMVNEKSKKKNQKS